MSGSAELTVEASVERYIAALAKNRRVWCQLSGDRQPMKYRLDAIPKASSPENAAENARAGELWLAKAELTQIEQVLTL